MTKEVNFETVHAQTDERLQDRIDDAYRAKYHSSSYLKPMIGAKARSATVRIVPRSSALH
jgi:hypothetical protein